MPRLLNQSGWSSEIIEAKDLRMGDLIFLKRKKERKLVSHAILVLDSDRFFHCKRNEGAVIESIEGVCEVYEQALKLDMLKYIDPRNKSLRNQYDDIFIS